MTTPLRVSEQKDQISELNLTYLDTLHHFIVKNGLLPTSCLIQF